MSTTTTIALVTGATAGIGAEFCRQLAERCGRIIATGRRSDKLDELANELGSQVELHGIAADLATEAGRRRVIQALQDHGPLDYLVNNAGFGALGTFAEADLDAQQQQVDLHVTATLALTRAALPAMIERGRGYIVNLSSVAAFFAYPTGMVYSGTKAFLNVFSEGLQAEVAGQGIKVQSLCPGYTYSEFHDREGIARAGFSREQVPPEMWMDASDVVAISLAALAGDQVVVVAGEHNLELARQQLRAQLDRLQPVRERP